MTTFIVLVILWVSCGLPVVLLMWWGVAKALRMHDEGHAAVAVPLRNMERATARMPGGMVGASLITLASGPIALAILVRAFLGRGGGVTVTVYYLAARYSRHAEINDYARRIHEEVPDAFTSSTWHRDVTPGLDESFDAAFLADHPEQAWVHGQRDLEDLSAADAIVSFTEGVPARGGRHVEHGVALDILMSDGWDGSRQGGMRLIVVGPREHVFHCHPATEVFADFEAFIAHERKAAK